MTHPSSHYIVLLHSGSFTSATSGFLGLVRARASAESEQPEEGQHAQRNDEHEDSEASAEEARTNG